MYRIGDMVYLPDCEKRGTIVDKTKGHGKTTYYEIETDDGQIMYEFEGRISPIRSLDIVREGK